MKSVEPIETTDWLGVFENLFKASHGEFEDGKPSVWDYSNPNDFTSLWKTLEDDRIPKASCVLIIWSKTPSDESLLPVNTSEHISPLHWAACAVKNTSRIRVCILDLNPSAHRGQYLYEHYLTCDKNRLPWLRVVQAAHLFGIENAQGKFEADALPVKIKGLFARLFHEFESKKASIEASHFVDRIRNELTSPQNAENRHAISNIIGPMILRSGRRLPTHTSGIRFIKNGKQTEFSTAAQSDASHRWALNSILRAAHLMSADIVDDQSNEQALEASAGWLAVDEECRKAGILPTEIRITLVDDQWTQGWLAWIKEGLGTTPVELQVSPDPDFLLQLLREIGCERRPFSLSLGATASERNHIKQDILLLDLRLFTSNATAEKKFATELKDMLGVAVRGQNASEGQRFRGDLAVVERRLQMLSGADVRLSSEEHARYVTMLPRLIASSDFSLPIIVFSSSGQREVLVEPFEKYPSIITTFSKPRHFQGENDNVVVNSEATLGEAFVRAIRWVRGRKLVQQIQSRSLVQLEKVRTRCAGHNHFELYFDESGQSFSPRFRCAALLVGYKTIDGQPYDKDAVDVHEQMRDSQLIWYRSSEDQVLDSDFLDKEQKNEPKTNTWLADAQWLGKVAEPLSAILGDRPAIPFVVSRTPVTSSAPDELDLAHPDALDNAFSDLIQLLIEVALVDVLPTIASWTDNVTLHVYGATRIKTVLLMSRQKINADEDGFQLWRKFQDTYGFDSKDIFKLAEWQQQPDGSGNYYLKYRSLRNNAMLPLLARSLAARTSSKHTQPLQKATKRCVAVVLSDSRPPEPIVRHQHYVCDRLAHICDVDLQDNDSIDLRILKTWKPFVESGVGFLGRRNQTFLNLLDCGRFLDAKDLSSAFALGGAVLSVEGLFAEAVASRLQAEISSLSPDLFDQLCTLLAENPAFEKRAVVSADRFSRSQSAITNQPNIERKAAQSTSRPSKPAFKPYVDAHVAKELEGCFVKKISPASQTDNSIVNKTAGPATKALFARVAKHWKIRRFKNPDEYMAANIPWHTMPGFTVRINLKQRITVFAELAKIGSASLEGFIDPDQPNLFTATGELCGKEYRP